VEIVSDFKSGDVGETEQVVVDRLSRVVAEVADTSEMPASVAGGSADYLLDTYGGPTHPVQCEVLASKETVICCPHTLV